MPFAVYGARREAIGAILRNGLTRGDNAHIVMLTERPADEAFAAVHSASAAYFYIDVRTALEAGVEFLEAGHGVILCAGDANGRLMPTLFDLVVELGGALSAAAPYKQPLVRTIERLFRGCSRVTVDTLSTGNGGAASLVLQTRTYDRAGRPNEPSVTRFDTGLATIEEVQRTGQISRCVPVCHGRCLPAWHQ